MHRFSARVQHIKGAGVQGVAGARAAGPEPPEVGAEPPEGGCEPLEAGAEPPEGGAEPPGAGVETGEVDREARSFILEDGPRPPD